MTPALPNAPADTPPKTRITRAISPELAANVREEDEALTATIAVAQTIAQAALSAANTAIAAAQARRAAAMRPILRQLGLDEADIVGTTGHGAETVLVLDVPMSESTTTGEG